MSYIVFNERLSDRVNKGLGEKDWRAVFTDANNGDIKGKVSINQLAEGRDILLQLQLVEARELDTATQYFIQRQFNQTAHPELNF